MVPETVKCGEKREPFSEQNDTKEEFKSHAFNLKVHLEVVSVFGKVSTFSFSGKNNSDQSTRSILSFEENDSSHLSPKIRRSSTPCLSSHQ
ncbi:hypothetical protein CRE_05977 [Caenorhabditis remanei]|uniref:Uncharacterized protein n=1 Tax=Caenorhabditis remanei TaxID=31234 RepID=E3MZC7_CAERE|nr:hypothetical protein CRE_05977 [Caenorhabditis remanei]